MSDHAAQEETLLDVRVAEASAQSDIRSRRSGSYRTAPRDGEVPPHEDSGVDIRGGCFKQSCAPGRSPNLIRKHYLFNGGSKSVLYAAFAIGVGNLGRGATRRPMSKWVEMLNKELFHGRPSVRAIGSFGHTGNFLVDSPSTDLQEVTAQFGRARCRLVLRPIDDVRTALAAADRAVEPQEETVIRWTPGFAFHGGRGIESGTVTKTAQGISRRSPRVL